MIIGHLTTAGTAMFDIDSSTGEVIVHSSLDREVVDQYHIVIKVSGLVLTYRYWIG